MNLPQMQQMIDLNAVYKAREALATGNVFAALKYLDDFCIAQPQTLTERQILSLSEAIKKTEYSVFIKRAVDTIAKAWMDGAFNGDSSSVYDAINDEATTSSHYTAKLALNFSASCDEAVEALIEARELDWCALAYPVMRADIYEDLKTTYDIDANDAPPREPVRRCASCDEWSPREETEANGGECDLCRDSRESNIQGKL